MMRTINNVSKFGPQRSPRSDLSWALSRVRKQFLNKGDDIKESVL